MDEGHVFPGVDQTGNQGAAPRCFFPITHGLRLAVKATEELLLSYNTWVLLYAVSLAEPFKR